MVLVLITMSVSALRLLFVAPLIASLTDLDHTADVQCHAWGKDMKDAFEHMAVCMLNYMTDVDLVEIDEAETQTIVVQGKIERKTPLPSSETD